VITLALGVFAQARQSPVGILEFVDENADLRLPGIAVEPPAR
jgi:hypothetical protein